MYKHRPKRDDNRKNEISKKLVNGGFCRPHDQYKDLTDEFFELSVNYMTLNQNLNVNLFIFRHNFELTSQIEFEPSD